MTNQQRIRTPESLRQASEAREVRSRLVNDYVENRQGNTKTTSASKATVSIEAGSLTFSVLEDMKLYGAEALDVEFQLRQYDPYAFHKARLAQSANTIGAMRESA